MLKSKIIEAYRADFNHLDELIADGTDHVALDRHATCVDGYLRRLTDPDDIDDLHGIVNEARQLAAAIRVRLGLATNTGKKHEYNQSWYFKYVEGLGWVPEV